MNRRTFVILAAVAALLALIAVVSQRGTDQASIAGDSAGDLFLPGLADAVDGIRAVQITAAGNERRVSLERSGDSWSVVELGGYAAAPADINGLLIDLAEARIVEEKTANPDFYDRLGVEPVASADAAGLEVTLEGDGDARFSVVLGEAYGTGQRYARSADAVQSVLIDRNPDIAREPTDWAEAEIIDIAASRVARVEITHADGERLLLTKDSPEQSGFSVADIPEGRELQYESIADVTGSVLAHLNMEQVSADADAGEPLAVIEFTTFDGLVVTVDAQAADGDDAWLGFSARAAAASAGTDTGADDDEAAADGDEAAAAAEADAINSRLGAWRYRIPAYKYNQLARRMDDLLRDLPATDE